MRRCNLPLSAASAPNPGPQAPGTVRIPTQLAVLAPALGSFCLFCRRAQLCSPGSHNLKADFTLHPAASFGAWPLAATNRVRSSGYEGRLARASDISPGLAYMQDPDPSPVRPWRDEPLLFPSSAESSFNQAFAATSGVPRAEAVSQLVDKRERRGDWLTRLRIFWFLRCAIANSGADESCAV
jgi:hypothetical protein